jgi:hypothetical protein
MIAEAGLQPPHVTRLARALRLGHCVSEADFLARWGRG